MTNEVALSEIASGISLPVPLSSLSEKIELNEFVAAEILKLFKWSVGSTVCITISLVIIDTVSLWCHKIKPDERLITEHVLMALIGASVVQLGAAGAAIVYGLFGRPNSDEADGSADLD